MTRSVFTGHGLLFAKSFRASLALLGLLLCASALWIAAAGFAQAQGIFTCVDAKGRKITADRPIADCVDRDQQELSRSGTVVRRMPPAPTAQERAAHEAREKADAAEQTRLSDDKRRERALVLRYPNAAVHNRERHAALAAVDDIIASSSQRGVELTAERQATASEMEFYTKDPTKVPFTLKSRIDAINANSRAQQTFVANQATEKQRINQRFDEEMGTLKPLWARNPGAR